MLSLSPDLKSTYLLLTSLWSEITYLQQEGVMEREEGEGIGWGVCEETVSSYWKQFRIHSITSYCDFYLFFSFCFFGRQRRALERAGWSGQHFAVGCFSLLSLILFSREFPSILLSNCLFFLSAYAIVTKALCKKAILISVCFYFMVITIVIILLFLLCFIFPQWIQLNATKPICKLAKQKEKLEYLVSGLKMEELPFHLDINTSQLYSHRTC